MQGENKVETMLRIYSSKYCIPCLMLEEFLKKHKIDFERIDVDENKIEVDEVPIIEKDGKVVMVGLPLNKEKLLEILK